jgi:hypothetical protein
LALPGRPLAVRVRRPHGSKSSHPIRQFPSSSHEKPICFHRQTIKSPPPLLLPVRFPLAAGGRVRGESFHIPIHRTAATKGRPPIGGGLAVLGGARLSPPTGPVGLVWIFESSRRGGLRVIVSRIRGRREAEMHKSRGKLSGVLHKGFKPDKWSVQIDFLSLPPRGGGGLWGF